MMFYFANAYNLDENNADYKRYHWKHGEVVERIEGNASDITGNERDDGWTGCGSTAEI